MKWFKSIVVPGYTKNHDSEPSISVSRLEEENMRLRRQLEEVVTIAAENEAIWRHFLEIERLLFRSRQFDQLTKSLLGEIKSRFYPDLLALFLAHPEILERFFPDLKAFGEQVGDQTWILPFSAEVGAHLSESSQRPIWLPEQVAMALIRSFAGDATTVRAALLVPLTVHELFFGALLLGSRDSEYYGPSDGTDLLEQLGTKIALCMDNCLAYERVKDLSDRDRLTNLLNFFQIHTVLEREFRRARRENTSLCVIVLDLDFVEEAGDHLDMGGPVLRHVANLLIESFPDGDGFIGRYGSHEFMMILPYATAEEAREVAGKLEHLIRRSPLHHGNTVILIQPRIGVAAMNNALNRPHDLLDAAMNRLYLAKTTSRVKSDDKSLKPAPGNLSDNSNSSPPRGEKGR